MFVEVHLLSQQGQLLIYENVLKDSIDIKRRTNGVVLISFIANGRPIKEIGDYSVAVLEVK